MINLSSINVTTLPVSVESASEIICNNISYSSCFIYIFIQYVALWQQLYRDNTAQLGAVVYVFNTTYAQNDL